MRKKGVQSMGFTLEFELSIFCFYDPFQTSWISYLITIFKHPQLLFLTDFLSIKLLGACVNHFYSHTFGSHLYTSSIFLAQGKKLHSLSFAKYKWRSTMICQKLCLALEIGKTKKKKKSLSPCHKDLPIVISRHKINHFGGRC